ncbi:MAG: glycosyltransferase family 4 protein [Bacteroidota bacterium]
MRILHTVESYLPSRHGMQEVVTQLSEKLVSLGHEVTIATSANANRLSDRINGVKIVSFNVSGNMVLGMRGETDRYQQFLIHSDFDLITNFAAQQWATDLALPVLNKITAKKIFVPTGFSALHLPSYKSYFEKMKDWMKSYDANIFLAQNYRDINFAKENNVPSIEIIPNGADEKEFAGTDFIDIRKQLKLQENSKLILTVGNHTGYKGHREAIEIFRRANISNSALLIIGKVTTGGAPIINLGKSLINLVGLKKTNCSLTCKIKAARFNALNQGKSILVEEMDRTATINAFTQADLFLFPSLLECSPIVLFEALAATTPFLVGDVGNAKEIIEWTGGGEMLPTTIDRYGFSHVRIKESAAILARMMNNKTAIANYSHAGNKAFIEKFTWARIAARYEELYFNLLKSKEVAQ